MTKRGDDLREHMLFTAKDVFLEAGFERASMDVIAERAGTTKRSLYAHFENKEKLYGAVVELVRGLLLGRMMMPAECGETTEQALVQFCAKFLESLTWKRSVRMFRLSIAEVDRFPEGAASFHEAMFVTAQDRLEAFLRERLEMTRKEAAQAASELIARVIYPGLTRALFGLEVIDKEDLSARVSAEVDLKPIRAAVADLMKGAAR